MQGWYDQLIANIKAGDVTTLNEELWDPSTWPRAAKGVGFMEAPRGALAHWIVIKDGKIDNYQAVVPSTWNAGPRDAQGQDGPYEAALKGHRCTIPTADRDPAHDPQLRPLYRLRRACDRSGRRGIDQGQNHINGYHSSGKTTCATFKHRTEISC